MSKLYRVLVYTIDGDPEKIPPVFEYETRPEATAAAQRWAHQTYVANADVCGAGGRVFESWTTQLGELVDLATGERIITQSKRVKLVRRVGGDLALLVNSSADYDGITAQDWRTLYEYNALGWKVYPRLGQSYHVGAENVTAQALRDFSEEKRRRG